MAKFKIKEKGGNNIKIGASYISSLSKENDAGSRELGIEHNCRCDSIVVCINGKVCNIIAGVFGKEVHAVII